MSAIEMRKERIENVFHWAKENNVKNSGRIIQFSMRKLGLTKRTAKEYAEIILDMLKDMDAGVKGKKGSLFEYG